MLWDYSCQVCEKASLVTLASLGLYSKHFSSSCTLTKILKLKNPILQIGRFKNKKRWERRHANCLKRAATGGSWAKMGGMLLGDWAADRLLTSGRVNALTFIILVPCSVPRNRGVLILICLLGSWSSTVMARWMCPVKYFPPSLSLKVLFGAGYFLACSVRQTQCSVWWIGLQVMGMSGEVSSSALKSWVC